MLKTAEKLPIGIKRSPVEIETRNRIVLSIAAYSYEFCAHSIMSDAEYDALSRAIDLTIDTSRPDLDNFFRAEFSSHTGMWIRRHPELQRLAYLYDRYYKNKNRG